MTTDIAQNIADDGADAAETAETTETVTAIGAIDIESMVAPPSPTQLAPIPTPRARLSSSRTLMSFRKAAK